MPYLAPHNVLQVFGSITTEGEVEGWSFGLRFGEGNRLMGANLVGPDDPNPAAALTAIENDLGTWWQGMAEYFPTAVRWQGFKFNAVDVNGRYVNQTTTYRRDIAAVLTGTGGSMLPPQVAVAVTLRTAAARGLASLGRVYLPPFSATTLDAGGRLNTAACDLTAQRFANLLTNLGNWPNVDNLNDYGNVCVMSKVRTAATRRVNRVDVGDLFDTMRSRRKSLREHRSPVSIVNS